MRKYGEFVKEKRLQQNLTLREFCKQACIDPSNWSKIERGILTPIKSPEIHNRICEVLKIEQNSEDFQLMKDLAAIEFIPKELIEEKIVEDLPLFFRTVRGTSPSSEELDKLFKKIKKSYEN
ncbi:MAG: helix-turn-helix domain-containing protein [Bacteroidales bacterium]|nr:helix-turn-helix domain-containing protein [Bacteroidales bacterium]